MGNFKKDKALLIFSPHLWYWTAPAPGIGYIASALEGIGVKVEFIDCQIVRDYKKKILSLLPEYPVVGLSVNAGNVSSALDIAGAIRKKSPETKIIMGGPHATAGYERLIPEYADIVVRGEGDDTIVELMQEDDLSRVKGIAYWNGELKVTPDRPYIEDLDRLRFPAWHLYDLKRYRLGNTLSPIAIIMTSRGCPYDCIYCVKCVHGYKIRFRSLDNVFNEINYLISRFGVKEIQIMDDAFTVYPERVKEFCKMAINRSKKLRFALGGGIRADLGNQEMFNLLVQAGCYMAPIAVEAGSQEVLNKIQKNLNLQKARKIINMANRAGLRTPLFFIIGFPFETLETMYQTIDLAKQLTVDQAHFFIATPFYGTKFYEIVKNEGKFLVDMAVTSTNYEYGPAVYETESLKAKDVEMMYKKAQQAFHFRLKYIWLILTTPIVNLKIIPGLIWERISVISPNYKRTRNI